MNEGPIKPNKLVAGSGLGTPDEVYFERKKQIFEALGKIVAIEKEKNPEFNISIKDFNELISRYKDMFPEGINSGPAVMNYWKSAGGLSYLQEKLGLPFKKKKDSF
jgi:hypothetical protein